MKIWLGFLFYFFFHLSVFIVEDSSCSSWSSIDIHDKTAVSIKLNESTVNNTVGSALWCLMMMMMMMTDFCLKS